MFWVLWQCGIEMDTSLRELTNELQALVLKFIGLRSAAHLRARMLRGLSVELNSAYSSGLTWREIWNALREHGYQGSYPQFCKTCRRLVGVTGAQVQSGQMTREILPPHGKERTTAQNGSSAQAKQQSQDQEREKPIWQRQREEVAARLDREAQEYRQREASKTKAKLFTTQPFEPPK